MMKLMSLKQFEKKSRSSLMRFINGYLKTQSKKQVAIFAYALAKSKLPRLPYEPTTVKRPQLTLQEIQKERKRFDERMAPRLKPKRKTKRKFSRKQLAAQRLFAKRAKAGTLKRRRR